MREILQRLQVNMPFQMLIDQYLPMVLKKRINLEIGFDCLVLDKYNKDKFVDIAKRLHDEELRITFHAPFFDLRPGAIDTKIREASIDRLKQVFELVPYFKPETVVCHAAFDEKYYASYEEVWLENSIETWRQFINIATEMNTVIALENVFENNPVYLGRLFDSLRDSSNICCCFDTGHFNAFSDIPLEKWMETIGSYIGEIHLHDNSGFTDEHAPVGEGSFPFHDFFTMMKEIGNRPIITLEPHTEEALWRTIENIKTMKILECLD